MSQYSRFNNQHKGLILRLIGVFLLSVMFALVKLASELGVHVLETLFYRFLFGFFFMFAWIARGPGLASVTTERPAWHLLRAFAGITAMGLNFWAVTILPFAEAAAISFTVPMLATVLSVILLAEFVGIHRWAATMCGFIGVLIVIQPGTNTIAPVGVIVGLSGAVCTALTFIIIRHIARTESSITIVFWYTAVSVPLAGLALIGVAQTHSLWVWGVLIAIGLLGAIGQVAISESLRWASISVVTPMDYSYLIWAITFGVLIWGDWPGLTTWIGSPIIIAAGLYVAWREHHLNKPQSQRVAPLVEPMSQSKEE